MNTEDSDSNKPGKAKDLSDLLKNAYERSTNNPTRLRDYWDDLQKLTNHDFRRQINDFRKKLINFLLWLMGIETFALFVIIILASISIKGVHILEIKDLTLQILVGATIAQVSSMLIFIIHSVYSDSLNKIIFDPDPSIKNNY